MTQSVSPLSVARTPIPGLLVIELPVHGDARGWFKENWQREKMTASGVPRFSPVQHNVSFNHAAGTTRGIHAEPWDKWVSVASGRAFGAWVDLREGDTFGAVVTAEIGPSRAVFVPRGVGNAYQTLEPNTAYTYLVTDHWSPESAYTLVNLADAQLAIPWPIPLSQAEISAKDRAHPPLDGIAPVPALKTLVVGAGGQLGRALRASWGDAAHVEYADREDLDLRSRNLALLRHWRDYDTIVNAAAYTAVDQAETRAGRSEAWAVNTEAVGRLARIAIENDLTLVHLSSDYVFDGSKTSAYLEEDELAPLGVYGQTKAAADVAVAMVPRHYIVRTSWVIGDGANFVTTMAKLAERGGSPAVVDDQRGRLTFTSTLAAGIRHLLESHAPYGTYNLTGSGPEHTWADVARRVFRTLGADEQKVRPVSTEEYAAASKTASAVAPRPLNSTLDLGRIRSVGFEPADADDGLEDYLRELATR